MVEMLNVYIFMKFMILIVFIFILIVYYYVFLYRRILIYIIGKDNIFG